MGLLASLFAGFGAVWLVAATLTRVDTRLLGRLGVSAGAGPGPSRLHHLVALMGRFLAHHGLGDVDRARTLASAAAWDIDGETLLGAKVAAGIVAAAFSLALLPLPESLVGLVVASAAYRAPDVLAARAAKARRGRMDAELPQLLDLLAAASHAGLAGPLALRRAVDATRGPLAQELDRVVDAVALGGRWRDELSACADRLALPDLRRAVAALTRTEHLGSSLADSMTELAARVRAARRAATTERARKAPVKMLFPLVFLVLPAFLLLTVAPVLFSTLRSIH